MANPHQIARKPIGAHDLVTRTRKGILGAFDVVESRGKLISEVLADAFMDNPLKFLDTASKYLPNDGTMRGATGIQVIINRDDVTVNMQPLDNIEDKPVIENVIESDSQVDK